MEKIAPFVMIVLIVGIVSFVRLQRAKYEALGRGTPGLPDGEVQRLGGELRQLRDRIAVLERIVTDGDHARSIALEREIAALRNHEEDRP